MVGAGPGKSRFYRVERVDLVPFRRAPKDASLQKDEKYLQQMLKAAFATKCFYFADNYDITLSAQGTLAHLLVAPLWLLTAAPLSQPLKMQTPHCRNGNVRIRASFGTRTCFNR